MGYSQYDPDKNIILIAGHRVRGFGDGSMFKIAYTSDRRGMREGVDGEARHVKYLSKAGTNAVTLSDFSASNDVFQLLDDGDYIFPIVVKDMTSKAAVFATQDAMVQKNPDFVRGKDPEDVEWIFQYTKGKHRHSGAKEAKVITILP